MRHRDMRRRKKNPRGGGAVLQTSDSWSLPHSDSSILPRFRQPVEMARRFIKLRTSIPTDQSGAAEAWWAHNPQVPGSKPGSDKNSSS
ncbi:UNVERIFIED_CONTAM: hypothetical protein Sangu_2398200 [Sesamum angustifolium]|uniref:Uncharacterized protein n=1 Tax=Sesamum angustifolium TaxID=2727405 RepID=A0AAW2KYQ8_9LAMI